MGSMEKIIVPVRNDKISCNDSTCSFDSIWSNDRSGSDDRNEQRMQHHHGGPTHNLLGVLFLELKVVIYNHKMQARDMCPDDLYDTNS